MTMPHSSPCDTPLFFRSAYEAAGMAPKLSNKGRTLKALLRQLGVQAKEVRGAAGRCGRRELLGLRVG